MLGSGTVSDPYIIENVVDLQNMNLDLAAYYELRSDIDASGTVSWNGGQGFLPIGTVANPFIGHFNGNNHIIRNLYMSWPNGADHGLFSVLQSPGELDSIILSGIYCDGGSWVTTTGNGGLVGRMVSGHIYNCHSGGRVRAFRLPGFPMYPVVGGLIGYVESGSLEKCSSSGSVEGTGTVGGLVGYVNTGMLNNICFSVADVISYGGMFPTYQGCAGGLVGSLHTGGVISNCYAKGNVTLFNAPMGCGGLVGDMGSATIENSYSTGLVTGAAAHCGGLVGVNPFGTVLNSFWDTETSGQLVSAGGTGKTTAQMKIKTTFTGWDFTFIWSMDETMNLNSIWALLDPTLNSGYPSLLTVPKLYLARALSRAEL